MSILIKGMDMPKYGNVYIRIAPNGEVYVYDVYPTELHDAIEIPKHGRLIDADRLKADNPRHMNADVPYVTEVTVEEIIDDAPTVIEGDTE